jgi:hypothetical protein
MSATVISVHTAAAGNCAESPFFGHIQDESTLLLPALEKHFAQSGITVPGNRANSLAVVKGIGLRKLGSRYDAWK